MGNSFRNKPEVRNDNFLQYAPSLIDPDFEEDQPKEEDTDTFVESLETKLIEEALENIYSRADEIVEETNFELTNSSSPQKGHKYSDGITKGEIKPFLGQNIEELRKTNVENFVDPYFKPSIKRITSSAQSDLFKILANSLRVQNRFDVNELSQRIIWKKCKVITYKRRLGRDEFVLDASGRPLPPKSSSTQYAEFFSVDDIFQGQLGDCFMIAAIMGMTQNKRLLSWLMPIDNALRNNMRMGLFHFRLWNLGSWYDVVVDDFLPADRQYNLVFTRNMTFPNEFWIALLEKAVAKFLGRYDILNGGNMENAALYFSGGIQDVYCTEIAKHLTDRSPFKSQFAQQTFAFLQNEVKRVDLILPNVEELFIIISCAVKRKDLVGAFSTYPNAEQIGIYREHQYALTDVIEVNKMRIVKIHNPHNIADKIKGFEN